MIIKSWNKSHKIHKKWTAVGLDKLESQNYKAFIIYYSVGEYLFIVELGKDFLNKILNTLTTKEKN